MRKLLVSAFLAMLLSASSFSGAARAEDAAASLNDAEYKEAVDFINGNALFVMLHEAGHMLVSELQLPVLGREEDAVDTLSSIMLLEAHDDVLDKAITDSADAWYLSGEQSADQPTDESAFWDTHGMDKQRAYQMICMMVGQDPEGFKAYADSRNLPQERRDECKEEYQKALNSWNAVLQPHAMPEGQKNTISISYEEPKPELAAYAKIIKDAQLLEKIAGLFSTLYKLNDGIQFVATNCDQPNAMWVPGERKLIYCYELAGYHDQIISKWLIDNRGKDKAGDAAASTETGNGQDAASDDADQDNSADTKAAGDGKDQQQQ